MQPHIHTGIVQAGFIVVVAVLGINLWRIAAAKAAAADNPTLQTLGKSAGGLVTFK